MNLVEMLECPEHHDVVACFIILVNVSVLFF